MFKLITIKSIELWAFGFFMISFFLPNKINGISTVLLGVIAIYKMFKKQHQFKGYAGLWAYPLLFVYLLLGMLYTSDLNEGWAIVERHLSLIIAPVIAISIREYNAREKQLLLDLFIGMSVVVGLYCLGAASLYYFETGTVYTPTQKDHFVYNHFMHQRLTAPAHLHAIYYTFFISVASVAILNQLLSKKNVLPLRKKIVYAAVFFFFFILIFLLKSSLFAFIFPLGCTLLVVVRYGKQILLSSKLKVIIIGVVFLAGTYMYQGVQTKLESFSTSYVLSDLQLKPLAIRLAMWECSWEVIKSNLLLGVGTGDGANETIEMYQQLNFKIGLENKFNSHDMYLQYWLSNGVGALLLFLTLLIFVFIKAIKSKNMTFFLFILFFSFFCLTESTMLRQKGIVFFVFLSSMFYWCPTLWNSKSIKE